MEEWQDQAVVLAARAHGEGAVASVLTEHRGRWAGYVYGSRGALQPGTLVAARWRARTEGQLGTLSLEVLRGDGAVIAADAAKLSALQSACALCDAALAERQATPGAFEGLVALLHILAAPPPALEAADDWGPVPDAALWPAAYVFWEVQLLAALGFPLELEACAAGGDGPLTHVSPKTGRAVGAAAAAPYAHKLLPLPGFLRPERAPPTPDDVAQGLALTGYFLEHKAFAQLSTGLPAARTALCGHIGTGRP